MSEIARTPIYDRLLVDFALRCAPTPLAPPKAPPKRRENKGAHRKAKSPETVAKAS